MPLRRIFDRQGHTYFITTTVMNFERIFAINKVYYDILLKSLKFVLKEHKACLIAYVFMPSHIHLIIKMPEKESISDLMRDFKKFTSTKTRQQLEKDNKIEIINRLKNYSRGYKRQVFKLWMDGFDDVIITKEKVLCTKINYIHFNPVKAYLAKNPEDWEYSSYRNYYNNDDRLIEVARHLI